jgi:hypothetical protein
MPAHILYMAYSFLIFDFGNDEGVAQQARHRIEGWKQGFRLDKKLQFQIDRTETQSEQDNVPASSSREAKGSSQKKNKTKSKSSDDKNEKSGHGSDTKSEISMIVRLDFSEHEKLSHQRWLERIPTEEPFKSAKPKIVRSGDTGFIAISERFDLLDHGSKNERTGLKV